MTQPKHATWPLYPRFIWSLLTGRPVAMHESPRSGELANWSKEGLEAVITVASTELASQRGQLDRMLGRAQLLFTTLLGLVALLVGMSANVWASSMVLGGEWTPRVLLLLSAALFLLALLGAAAIMAVRKEYDGMSAIPLSNWDEFDPERLAREYAASVGKGHETNAAHLTVFGVAVRLTLYGVVALALAWVAGNLPPMP